MDEFYPFLGGGIAGSVCLAGALMVARAIDRRLTRRSINPSQTTGL